MDFPFRLPNVFVFFFQAEDGIRHADVTGVQTCALPISPPSPQEAVESLQRMVAGLGIRRGLTAGSSDFPTRPCRRRRHRNDAEAEVRCDDGFSCTSTRLPLPYRKRSGVNKSGELCSCRGIAPGLGGPASPLRPMPPSSRPRLFLAQPGSA